MRKEIIISTIVISVLLGCNVTNNNEIKSSSSPSYIPSIKPSNVSIESTISEQIKELNWNKDKLCYQVYCTPIKQDDIDNPKIREPIDLSVTNDGKYIYITTRKKPLISVSDNCGNSNIKESSVEMGRSYVYKISSDKKISVLKINDNYDYSCSLGSSIEIDKNNNLYFIMPSFNKERFDKGLQIIRQDVIKIENESRISKIIPLVKSNNIEYTYFATNLYVSKQDSLITYAKNPFDAMGNKIINKINEDNSIENLYIYDMYGGSVLPAFIFEDNKLNFGGAYIEEPYPYKFDPENSKKGINAVIPIGTGVQVLSLKMNSKKEVFVLSDYYTESKRYHSIYKIVPNKGAELFAGSTEAGYKDGNGAEARFNNPSSIDFDASDNMYVADTGNNAIRKITPNGDVTTFFKQN